MIAVLATIGLAVVVLVGCVVLDVIGQMAVSESTDAVFRRPSFAERRHRSRGLMKTGVALSLVAATAGWIWLAAATSGHAEDADDARFLGIVTAASALLGCVCLAAWWRRAGAPRH